MKTIPARTLLASAILMASGGQVFAQSDNSLMLEEIIVTAQKREQSIQDIPIAVSAFDKASIERQRIKKVTDISLYAPNVEVVDTPTNTTAATIAIRGASQINPAITWENSVGIYIDGVFIGKNLGAVFDVVELERVEVLRGPQGTLYGKNTVGGAINLITRKPSGEFGGHATAEFGNEGYWSGRASVDTDEWAGLKATVTLYKEERDGFYDNKPDPFGNPFAGPPSDDEFQDADSEAARIALMWDVTDSISALYSYDYSDQKVKPRLGQLTQTSLNSFLSSGGLQDAYLTKEDDRADDASNDWSFNEEAESNSHALDITWTGDNIAIRSITSYRDLNWNDLLDIDGTPVDIFHSGRDVDYDSFSQELQLTGSLNNLDYVLGAYYFDEDADVFNPITFFGAFGVPTANNRYGLDNNSVAVFGQADWRPDMFNERLTLSLGVRWTEEDKDQYIDHPGIYSADTDDTFDNTSPTVAVSWAFTDDINGYARYAKGWKSGGFNGEASSEESFLEGYDDEEVTAYELGLKSLLLNGRLQLNAAAFYNEIEDFQLSVFEGAAAASLVLNVPEFETKGFELEAVALVTEDLRLNLAYGYLDADYEEFPKSFTLFDKDEAGIPYAPENTFTLGADWTVARTDYGIWDIHVDFNYTDEYVPYIDPDQVETSSIDDRSLVNARLALSEIPVPGDGSLLIALWGQNITDEEYRINTIPFGGVDQRVDPNGGSGVGWTTSYFGAPRTYGVELTYTF
jgi:iron complex outermembrane receptor protein